MSRARRDFYMQTQVEAGHVCPITMTFASVAALKREPKLASQWLPTITARVYDPRNIPAAQKQGLTIGMAMTEKQGGSDVRANTTRADSVGSDGPGRGLRARRPQVLRVGADVRRVSRPRPGAERPHLLPRAALASRRNARIRCKLSGSSARWAMYPTRRARRSCAARSAGGSATEGRGVATIIEMVALTRFDCMIGSSGGMRHGGVAGNPPLPPAQGVRRLAHRPAADAATCSPISRSRRRRRSP